MVSLITETTSRASISSVGIVKNRRMIEVISLLRRQNQSSENGSNQAILVEKDDNSHESLFKIDPSGGDKKDYQKTSRDCY